MLGFIKKMFGTKYDRDVKEYTPVIAEINQEFERLQSLSHDQLRNRTLEFREQIKTHLAGIDEDINKAKEEALNEADMLQKEQIYKEVDELVKARDKELEVILKEILPEAFAVVKETARRFTNNETITVTATDHDRELAAHLDKNYVTIEGDKATYKNTWTAAGGEITWNMVHYDVQLIGGMVLHDGKIAEMATGEGKTLVATLPAYLNGLSGLGVHVITVNNYLARRDCEWIGPVMEFLFLTIDCIDKYRPHSAERVKAYRSDITYGTNNEFGFDYLRDNMVLSQGEVVQGKHHFSMIDEVDSVLIDDARTPLIISGPVPKGDEEQEYITLKTPVEKLLAAQRQKATQYLSQAKKLFAEGNDGYEEGDAGMALLRAYRSLPKYRPLIKFLSEDGVRVMLQRAENHYMAEQNKHMHKVDDELLFVIDEKNRSVELTEKGSDYLSKNNSDPTFFVMPDITTSMMEVDQDEDMPEVDKEEAKRQIGADFATKSRRLHAINQLLKAYTLFEKEEEYVVMDGQVKIVDEQTGRMMEGRRYSDGLHQALEAKENVKVGNITQTYATITLQNYFRMYHKLSGMTGTAETEASELWEIYKLDVVVIPTNRPIQRDDRQDLVYKTEREKFQAVINDVVKLTAQGRPVLVGTTTVDVSEKLSRMLKLNGIEHNVLNAKQHQREAEIVSAAGKPGAVTIATNMAGRGTDIKISDGVKAAGGLAIIGTERHDSRRVDRQLRGRAGRQGDPGSSQFYISLEDKLMRLFQSDRITKSIERAQKKVEENNFGIRKRLLEYDDVMNIQREAIYKKRGNALSGDRLSVDLNNMFDSLTASLVTEHKQGGSYDTFRTESMAVLGMDPEIEQLDFEQGKEQDLVMQYQRQFDEYYSRKEGLLVNALMPVIKDVFEREAHRYKRISIPYSDGGNKILSVSAELEKAVNTNGGSIMRDIEKAVALSIIDDKWKEHLRANDELKDAVQSASFEQKDPLVVYKMEAYNLFENLIYQINEEATSILSKGAVVLPSNNKVQEAKTQKTDLSKTSASRSGAGAAATQQARASRAAAEGASRPQKVETFKREEKKIGRNDACPCGSGKKYKQCHGKR